MKSIKETNSNKAVIYCRVSTKEQVEEGNSLITQEKICREYALRNGFEVAEIFVEQGESAKTADRTELKKLVSYCSVKANGIKAIIIYRLDRLSRNTDDYSQLRILFRRYGVDIKSTSENFENTPVGRFMENTMANIAQFDNDVRTERSVGGMKEATRSGRYVWMAPLGYNNIRIAGKATIRQDDIMGPIMHQAFRLVATNTFTVEQVRQEVTKRGLRGRSGKPVNKGYFYKMLSNEVYCGWIDKFGERNKGTFEPIVSEELFNHVQMVLKKKGRKNIHYLKDNPDFPLRRFVRNETGVKLTGCWSKGKRSYFPYYRFRTAGVSFNRDKFEKQYMEYVDQFKFDESKLKKLKEMIKKHVVKNTAEDMNEMEQLSKKIEELKKKQTAIIEKNLEGIIPDSVLKHQIELIDEELFHANCRIQTNIPFQIEIEDHLDFLEVFLKKPSEIWRNATLEVQKQLQVFQFPQGMIYENGIFRTPEMCSFYKEIEVISTSNSPKVTHKNQFANTPYPTIKENMPLEINFLKSLSEQINILSRILKEVKGYPTGFV